VTIAGGDRRAMREQVQGVFDDRSSNKRRADPRARNCPSSGVRFYRDAYIFVNNWQLLRQFAARCLSVCIHRGDLPASAAFDLLVFDSGRDRCFWPNARKCALGQMNTFASAM